MSEHYISCARCDKEIVIKTCNDCYSSEIDGQLVCRECWQKEQPKFLSNKIADLEAKLAEKEKDIKWLTEEYNKERHRANEIANTAMKHNYDMAIQQLQRAKEKIKSFYGEYSASAAGCFIEQIIKELEGKL